MPVRAVMPMVGGFVHRCSSGRAAQHSAIIGQGFSPLARRVVPIMTHYVGAA